MIILMPNDSDIKLPKNNLIVYIQLFSVSSISSKPTTMIMEFNIHCII